jgi:transposase
MTRKRRESDPSALVIDGPIYGDLFLAYVQQQLAPTLRTGEIVLLEKVSSHRCAGVCDAIEVVRATQLYLPSYSPDVNPIERAFSKWNWLLKCARKGSTATTRFNRRLAVSAVRRQRVGRERLKTPGIVLTARTEFVQSFVRDARGRTETVLCARSKP